MLGQTSDVPCSLDCVDYLMMRRPRQAYWAADDEDVQEEEEEEKDAGDNFDQMFRSATLKNQVSFSNTEDRVDDKVNARKMTLLRGPGSQKETNLVMDSILDQKKGSGMDLEQIDETTKYETTMHK